MLLQQSIIIVSVNVYFDFEFTGLHQHTTPISLGMVDANGRTLYCEFNDYDLSQVDDWLTVNVIAQLKGFKQEFKLNPHAKSNTEFCGNKYEVAIIVEAWLLEYDQVQMWGDCLAYDWMLFCELFGGALNIPKNVYYIPLDLSTLFKIKGIDPDISRVDFADRSDMVLHNALTDAQLIRLCYNKCYYHTD